jgi:CheY-like chemotaxis protein
MAQAEEERHQGVRVVVVDDTDDIRMLLRLALETDPRYVIVGEASNGMEAIEVAADLQPDLVVLDRHMPVLDGVQALPALRRLCPDTAILLFTANADEATRQLAMSSGADQVWSKLDVPLLDMADELAHVLLDRLDRGRDQLTIRLGPLPSSAARVWIRNTMDIVRAVNAHLAAGDLALDLPEGVTDLFLGYLQNWLDVADAEDEFFWAAGADPADARRLIECWATIDAMPDDQLASLGCHWSPPEGEPFFHALTGAVLEALARHESTRDLAESLRGQWS